MTTPNPNWPTLFAEASFAVNPFYSTGQVVYTDLTPRLYKQWSVRRGKQYELDQVQPAEFRGQWVNTDGFVDPSNTSSPFYPDVVPYRGYRMRAQYPPSVNVLTRDQATGGEGTPVAPGSIPASMQFVTDVGATLTIAASATAWQGSQVIQAAVPASSPVHFYAVYIQQIPVQSPSGFSTPTYTWSTYLRCTTASINPTVALALKFFDINGNFIDEEVGGNVTLTGSATAGWTRLTLTRSMSFAAGAAYVDAAVALEGTPPASPWTLQMDGSQFEQNTAASSFSVPGIGYPIMSGAIERYPQAWDYNGTYGVVSPIGVDTMALLSQTLLTDAFVSEVVETSPAWYYQLNEAGGATAFVEQGGRAGNAAIVTAGTGSCSPGSSITAATLPGGKFLGGSGPVVTFNNGTNFQGSFINFTNALSTIGPVNGSGWTRMIAFRTNSTTVNTMAAITDGSNYGLSGAGTQPLTAIQIQINGSSGATVQFTSPGGGGGIGVTTSTPVNDNNWHLLFISVAADQSSLTLTVDTTTATSSGGVAVYPGQYLNDSVGGAYYSLSQSGDIRGWVGDLAHYASWNTVLSSGTKTALYNAWRSAGQGETSGARYSRILRYANYLGAQNIDTGSTTNMGPCNDINGQDALTSLQNVVDTEYGRHFVDVNGTITFQSRFRAFTTTTPLWTFGENQAAGEIPYVNLAFDYDPTHISNLIQVTQNTTSNVYTSFDTTSEQSFGVRNLTRNNQSADATEVQQQAYFLVSRYKNPYMRVNTLTIDVAANPALWASVLQFELGQYIAINRRSVTGAAEISINGFIEQITHTGDDQGKWLVDLQISPVPTTAYAVFTALKTTLNTGASSGANVITINALPDAATNPVRSELTGGQQLIIGSGANQETVTIATGGVQNQAAGYTTAQLTLTANLAHNHVTGEQVIEVNGVSYDALGVFDTSLFPY